MSYNSILDSAGINPNICFKYDNIYFPYITVWYSEREYKTFYQLFYNSTMAHEFRDILGNRGKNAMVFGWSTTDLEYKPL